MIEEGIESLLAFLCARSSCVMRVRVEVMDCGCNDWIWQALL